MLGTIDVLTAADGLGAKPALRWAPVEGAVKYSLVVLDGDGRVYWAWRGSATEVTFGGGEAGGSAGQTAYLHQPMTWTVVAYDESLLPIAISSEAGLAP